LTKIEEYRHILSILSDWDGFLLENSGLPGPRGNLELAQAVADLGSPQLFERYRGYHAVAAPTGSPYEFMAFCGVLGLGRLLAEGQAEVLPILRASASDPRWRLREAVAMALQRYGDSDMPSLIYEMQSWSMGSPLEQRAAAAALCEPRLLSSEAHAHSVLLILDRITASIFEQTNRGAEDFHILRQGLGYCWSVVVASDPKDGKTLMEKWLLVPDPDIQWIMRENLKKNRLRRMDAAWVNFWQVRQGEKS